MDTSRKPAVIDDILGSWSWTGATPDVVVDVNKFGNVIFQAVDGTFWRICPEELLCEVIADSQEAFLNLRQDADFQEDWAMSRLVDEAEIAYGVQPEGRCFCLKIPGVLGGAYSLENVGAISISELLRFSGDIAEQIHGLPDGAEVSFKFVD